MKRILLLITALAAALALAPGASARIVELGADRRPRSSQLPRRPCQAAVRVTGYQGRAAAAPRTRTTSAATARSSPSPSRSPTPTDEQVDFFNDHFGSPAQVRLVDPAQGRHAQDAAQPPARRTRPSSSASTGYFGSSPTFVLDEPLRGQEDNIGSRSPCPPGRRSSRSTSRARTGGARRGRKNSCEAPRTLRQFAMTELRQVNVFGCTYHGAAALHGHLRARTTGPRDHGGSPTSRQGLSPAPATR